MKLSNHNANVVRCLPFRKRYVIQHTKFSPLVLGAADMKPRHLPGSHSVQPLLYDKRAPPHSEDGDETLYCVCRQPYNPSMWMIACDICDGWFHGRCVSITAQEARRIEKYVCPVCRLNTGKQILWKKPKKKSSKHNSKREVRPGAKKEDSNGTATSDNPKKRSRRPSEEAEARARKRRRKPEAQRKLSPQNSPSPGLTEENSHSSTPSIEDDESLDSPYANSSSISSNTDVIKCVCGKDHEDGLMVQCETCSCWLHCSCLGFNSEEEIPESYVCPPCSKKDDKSVASLLCSMPKMSNNFKKSSRDTTEDSGDNTYRAELSNRFKREKISVPKFTYPNGNVNPQRMLNDLSSPAGLLLSSAEAERLTFGKEYS